MITEKQRRLLLERANHQSEMLHYSEELGWHRSKGYCGDGKDCTNLHVHHIEPVRIGKNNRLNRKEIDCSGNVVVLFECEHNGRCKDRKLPNNAKYVEPGNIEQPVIHEDTTVAYQTYNGIQKPTSFDIMNEIRAEMVNEGEVYWEDSYDKMFVDIAEEVTKCKAAEGWRYYTIED